MTSVSVPIYQIKITLKHSKPNIWRRIEVPSNISFLQLHYCIQEAMGWYNCHLFQFIVKEAIAWTVDTIIAMPYDDDFNLNGDYKADETLINKYLKVEKDKLIYEYDFGDGWEHDIVLEKILQAQPDLAYPRLTAGKCACPPEDCGGIWGYYEMVKAINNPKHPNHDDMIEWIEADEWDVKEFDLPKEGVVLDM